jgi:hypothetical protein
MHFVDNFRVYRFLLPLLMLCLWVDSRAIQLLDTLKDDASDVEETQSTGSMRMSDDYIELNTDGANNQLVGLRFTGMDIEKGSSIKDAYIQFRTDANVGAADFSLGINAVKIANAPIIPATKSYLTQQPKTTMQVPWNLKGAWPANTETAVEARTPDISLIISQLVSLADWAFGTNSVIIISPMGSPTGYRAFPSYRKNPDKAPILKVNYYPTQNFANTPGSASASSSATSTTPTLARDGMLDTRWESDPLKGDSAWWLVEMSPTTINQVYINWRSGAQEYEVLGSANNTTWQVLAHVTDGKAEECRMLQFPDVTMKYVKFHGLKRTGSGGYSINELEVYAGKSIQPLISFVAADTFVQTGLGALTYTAVVAGSPVPRLVWYRVNTVSGAPDSVGVGFTFQLSNLAKVNNGLYFPKATNTLGSAVGDTFQVTVIDPVTITAQPTPVSIAENSSATFSVVAIGDNLTYQWYKISGGATGVVIAGAINPTLVLSGVPKSSDGSAYYCIVSNPVTKPPKQSTSALLTVSSAPAMPTITSPESDIVVAAGSPVSFTAIVSGSPLPQTVWYHINPSTGASDSVGAGLTFQIPILAKTDNGQYYPRAINSVGSVNGATFRITVFDPVVIQTQPTNRSVAENLSATFSISATGDNLAFQWYKIAAGQTPIATGTPVANANDSLLVITKVTRADSGTWFYCLVSNPVTTTPKRSESGRLDLAKFYNPFHIKVARIDPHDTTQIALTVWSDVKLTAAFYEKSILPYADTIRAVYATRSYPPTIADADTRIFNVSVADIAATGKDTLTKILPVLSLPAVNDSSYYFAYSLLWHIPGSGDTLLMPLSNGARLFMKDTAAPVNTIGAVGAYYSKSDSVLITLSNAANLDSLAGSVRMQLSLERDYSIVFLDTVIPAAVVKAAGASYRFVVRRAFFYGVQDTTYMRWTVIGKNSVGSRPADNSFIAGWSAPIFSGSLAATPLRADWIRLQWAGAQNADSLKLWWSTDTIPSIASPDPSLYWAKVYGPAQTFDTLTGLSGTTRYFFAIQIFEDGLASIINDGAKASARTLAGDTAIRVENRIVVDTTWFDTDKNALHAVWTVDTTVTPENGSLEFGAVWSLNSTQRDVPKTWLPVDGYNNVTDISLGSEIMFDTTYYLVFWLRGVSGITGPGAPMMPSETGIDTVRVGAFSWQVVRYSPTDSIVYANNRKIQFKGLSTSFSDTVKAYTPKMPVLDGMTALSQGFVLTNGRQENITISVTYGNLPAGIMAQKIRLYRIVGDTDLVVERKSVAGSGVVSEKTYLLKDPFILLADQTVPVVTLDNAETDTSQVLVPDMPVIYKGKVTDNISNCIWKIQYARGNEDFVKENAFIDTLTAKTGLFAEVIYQTSFVSEVYGLRVWLIVDDGVNIDTLDFSRQVQTANAGEYSLLAKKWWPVSVAADLEDPVASHSLIEAGDPGTIASYDNTQFRLFRWGDRDSGTRSWQEYTDSQAAQFAFEPSRLYWMKTAKDQRISFTKGITPSLKRPVEVVLKANSWTDFALPFKFDIMMRDLLAYDSTIVDSLQICHWLQDDSVFTADFIYNKKFPDLAARADTFTMVYAPFSQAYTVFNASSSDVTLKIPPLPKELSGSMRGVSKASASKNAAWAVWLNWRPSAGNNVVSRIRCGYDGQGDGKPAYYPLPPSFRRFGAGVVGAGVEGIYGNVITHSMADGGLAWEICFYNNDDTPQTIQYCLDNLNAVPAGMQTSLLDTRTLTAAQSQSWQEVTIEPNTTEKQWIVVGNSGYAERFQQRIGLGILAFMNLYPNPARHSIHIRYSVPPVGYRNVKFALYDMQGRMVWSSTIGKPTHAGASEIVWDGTNHRSTQAASGMYLLRMTALNDKGKLVIVGEKRVTYLP